MPNFGVPRQANKQPRPSRAIYPASLDPASAYTDSGTAAWVMTAQTTVGSTPTGVSNSFEGGTDGTNLTIANSGGASGTAFTIDTSDPFYSSVAAAHGSISAQFVNGVSRYIGWDSTTLGTLSDGYGRAYSNMPSLPNVGNCLIQGMLTGVIKWQIYITTTGLIQVQDGAAAQQAISTATITAGTWYRLEFHHNSASQLVVRIYTSMDSPNFAEEITAAANTASNINTIRYGQSNLTSTAYIDDVNAGATSWPGAYFRQVETMQSADSSTASLVFDATPSTEQFILASSYLLSDAWGRTNSSSWGSPGGSLSPTGWTLDAGTAANFSTNNTAYGHIIAGTASAAQRMKAGVSVTDFDVTGTIRCTTMPSTSNIQALIVFRQVDANNFYRLLFLISSGGQLNMQIQKVVSNVTTNIGATGANVAVTTATGYTVNQVFNYHVIINGSSLVFKLWDPANAEPAGTTAGSNTTTRWAIDTSTDTTYTAAGNYALGVFSAATNSPVWDWGAFDMTTVSTGTAYTESATAAWVITASAAEDHSTYDSATAANVYAAISVEDHTTYDTATAAFVLTASAVEDHTTYDTATAAWTFVTSAVENAQFVDSTTATWTCVTSAVETIQAVETATAQNIYTPSATEGRTSTDAATASFILATSATELTAYVDAATVLFVLTSSATGLAEEHTTYDSATAAFVLTASATIETIQAVETGTAANIYTASATEVGAFVDTATAAFVLVTSATDVAATTEVATANFVLVASATEGKTSTDADTVFNVYTMTALEVHGYYDSDTALNVYVASTVGTDIHTILDSDTAANVYTTASVEDHSTYDTGTGVNVYTASSTELTGAVDAATISNIYTAGGTEGLPNADVGTGTWVVIPTAATLETFQAVDSAATDFVLTASATETKIQTDAAEVPFTYTTSATETKIQTDAGTVSWITTVSSTELHTNYDTDTGLWIITASATVELHTILDSATALSTYTASAEELWIAGDSATISWINTAGGTDQFAAGTDVGTGAWVLTAITYLEEFGKIDSATALNTYTSSAAEGKEFVDTTGPAYWVITTDAVDFLVQDADTALWGFEATSTETVTLTTTGTATNTYTASGLDTLDTSDASEAYTAFVVYEARTIEQFSVVDFFLTAVQVKRWTTKQLTHFTSIQKRHFATVVQVHRWSVKYKGRGFFNG